MRQYLEAKPRPINIIKTYGADKDGRGIVGRLKEWIGRAPAMDTWDDYGDTQEGTERWWRHLIGGAAAVRFHRPPSGIGLNADAQYHVHSAKMFLKEFNIVVALPDVKHELLSDRSENEAYLTRVDGEAYAAYFPDGGDVRLSIAPSQEYNLKWLDISASRWRPDLPVHGEKTVRLEAPKDGQWLALVKRK